jgi:hypothetical protein
MSQNEKSPQTHLKPLITQARRLVDSDPDNDGKHWCILWALEELSFCWQYRLPYPRFSKTQAQVARAPNQGAGV